MRVVVRREGVPSALGQFIVREGLSKIARAQGRQIVQTVVEKTGGQQGSPALHVPGARTVAQGVSPHQARMGGGGPGRGHRALPQREDAVSQKLEINVGVDVSKEKLDVHVRPLARPSVPKSGPCPTRPSLSFPLSWLAGTSSSR